MGGTFTYHQIRAYLVRVDDQIKAADGKSWLPPVTHVDSHTRPYWTSLWWSTRPTHGMVSPADLTRPNDQKFRIRRPRPNHDVTLQEVADEFTRNGRKVKVENGHILRVEGRGRKRSALLHFYFDTGTFNGAYIGSEWVRSLDVVRRHLNIPTYR